MIKKRMMKKSDKKAIAMTFNWMFAIIVGGFILFLAIFAAGKFIESGEQTIYTETAASLVSLFDPLETGIASGIKHVIEFQKQSRLNFVCEENYRTFGRQKISFSEQTFGEKYGDAGGNITIRDKYIFSENVVEGKIFYSFSIPFFMPFKIMDQIFIISSDDNYCFYDSPEDIRESLEGLKLGNVIFVDPLNQTQNCEGIDVCFGDSKCDIYVNEDDSYVLNRGKGRRAYYAGDLIYGAIFSSPEIYECNVKRMKVKFDQLAGIYLDKIDIIERQDCRSNIGPKLSSVLGGIENSAALIGLYNEIEEIDKINSQAASGCQVYYNGGFGR